VLGLRRSGGCTLTLRPAIAHCGAITPPPREAYTQTPNGQTFFDGYRVVLEYQGKLFDYRAHSQGLFFLCPEEVPQGISNAIIEDVKKRTGAGPMEILWRDARAERWADGSVMECSNTPREFWPQGPFYVYQVTLEYPGTWFHYLAISQGSFFLCEKTPIPGSLPGGIPIP
jgi:hypothetical protein